LHYYLICVATCIRIRNNWFITRDKRCKACW